MSRLIKEETKKPKKWNSHIVIKVTNKVYGHHDIVDNDYENVWQKEDRQLGVCPLTLRNVVNMK